MSQSTISSDLFVSGNIGAKTMTIPASSVTDASVVALAGIQATKLQHQHQKAYSQPSGAAATSEQRVVHVVNGATGTVVAFVAGAVTPATGNDVVAVDLWKNGVSILSATITLNNTQSARQLVTGTLSSNATVAGDVFEVKFTATHNTGVLPQEVFAQVVIQEAAQ